jgi:hypothetical protein
MLPPLDPFQYDAGDSFAGSDAVLDEASGGLALRVSSSEPIPGPVPRDPEPRAFTNMAHFPVTFLASGSPQSVRR